MGNLARDRSNNAETGFFDCIEESQPCDQPAVILIRHYFRSGFYSWCALRFYLADLLFYVVNITTGIITVIIICFCFQKSKAQEVEWLLQMRLSWRDAWHGKRKAWRPYRIHYVMIYPDWQKRNRYLILESSVCFFCAAVCPGIMDGLVCRIMKNGGYWFFLLQFLKQSPDPLLMHMNYVSVKCQDG